MAGRSRNKESGEGISLKQFALAEPDSMVLSDNPIGDYREDALVLEYQLGSLYGYIRSPQTETPLTVAITGTWGSGKTSAMRWLHGMIGLWNKDAVRKQAGDRPSSDALAVKELLPVWFFPWKYDSKDMVRRGLIGEILAQTTGRDVFGKQRLLKRLRGRPGTLRRLVVNAGRAAKVNIGSKETGVEVKVGKLAEAIFAWYLDIAHPERAYRNEFETILHEWVKRVTAGGERIIIFIDDLDRCLPDVALTVLETLKLYLNTPGLVFVIGVNREIIDDVVSGRYEQQGVDRRKGHQYLEKIFQIEVRLSPREAVIEKFVNDLFEKHGVAQLFGHQDADKRDSVDSHLEVIRRVILSIGRRNPRTIKRLLSAAFMISSGELAGQKVHPDPDRKFTTSQAFQCCLIQKILESHLGARDMLSTEAGGSFFHKWSEIVREGGRGLHSHISSDDFDQLRNDGFGHLGEYSHFWELLRDDGVPLDYK